MNMNIDITREDPILIFGNIVNNLMIGEIEEKYAYGMNLVMPRKLWLAQKGDVIVIPNEISQDFKEYVLKLIDLDEKDITVITFDGNAETTLVDRITESPSLEKLRHTLSKNDKIRMLGFGYDKETLTFAKQLGVELLGYEDYPSDDTVNMFYEINTKKGFRDVAVKLGLNVGEGQYCDNEEELVNGLYEMLQDHEEVIAKFNRSSNGFGHVVFQSKENYDLDAIREKVNQHLQKFPKQPKEFIIEKYYKFINLPSIELSIEKGSVSELYTCDQFCYNNSWGGMITPPTNLTDDQYAELRKVGEIFGEYVRENGFRGICDVDTGITEDGEIILSESNFRRTGGTYLDFITRRLVDPNYYQNKTCFWIADVKKSNTKDYRSFASTVAKLEEEGLLFNTSEKIGVILTAMTYDIDSKWRYLIIGKTEDYVVETEKKLAATLNFI